MKPFSWADGAAGAIVADGKRLEAAAYGPAPGAAPTGFGVFVYSRAGYGRSDPVDLPLPLDYMTREARFSLPQALEAVGLQQGVLIGHSDGASIAAIYAGEHADER